MSKQKETKSKNEKTKKKQEEIKIPTRRLVLGLLAQKYAEDYQASILAFPEDKRIEFIEHLLECLDIIEAYFASPTEENWKPYAQKENAFLKKHGKRLKIYNQKQMHLYYGDIRVLVAKGIYQSKDWNALKPEEQELSPKEFAAFLHLCRNGLHNDRNFLLQEQTPEDEREEKNTKETLTGNQVLITKNKIKRGANDKLTCLSQEQTALLMYYLQQEKVLLAGEYLSDKDAGTAFEILTGYSQNTLRQTLSKYNRLMTKENLKELGNLLTHIQIAIGKDLKGNLPPFTSLNESS